MSLTLLFLLTLAGTPPSPLPAGPLKEATFRWEPKRPGTRDTDDHLVETFEVPEGVHWLIAIGCGGGGGGGAGGTSTVGEGGNAFPVRLSGGGGAGSPLLSYAIPTTPGTRLEIKVGRGGPGGGKAGNGSSGRETMLGAWTFPGGARGVGAASPTQGSKRMITPGGAGGHQGAEGGQGGNGGSGHGGDRLGPGSNELQKGGRAGADVDGYHGGGGGGAGIDGPGGAGGPGNRRQARHGEKATGLCGGGGGGSSTDKDGESGSGGAGAGGWLQIWYADVEAQKAASTQLILEVLANREAELAKAAEEEQKRQRELEAQEAFRELKEEAPSEAPKPPPQGSER